MDSGADLGKKDLEGMTPIHQASRTGRVHILQWLLDRHPYGYLPDSYLITHPQHLSHNGQSRMPVQLLDCLLAWVYPVVEATASILCCLPFWQTCTDSPTTPNR